MLQELIVCGHKLYYYSRDTSNLEIDFVLQNSEIYPIEVKAEENLKSKSLRTVYESNNKVKPVRISMSNYRVQDWITNVPLYLAGEWFEKTSNII